MSLQLPTLPPAKGLMSHSDDSRHLQYFTWIVPEFLPYMRNMLIEVARHPALEANSRKILGFIAEPDPTPTGCRCLEHTAKLRTIFKPFVKVGMGMADDQPWRAVAVAMYYFMLVTDFFFAIQMSDQMKANHRAQLYMLAFSGPQFHTYLLR